MGYVKLTTKCVACRGHKHVGIVLFTVKELKDNPEAEADAEKWRNKIHESCVANGGCCVPNQETTYLLRQGSSPKAVKFLLNNIRTQAKDEAVVCVSVFSANNDALEEVH